MSVPTPTTAREINRLHEEVVRGTEVSKEAIHAALTAAWKAGHLLRAEKKRVWKTMGRGAWLSWLEENFRAKPRTAQKYMLLAENVSDVATLQAMSLRQVYLQLGIATEPKGRSESLRVEQLPPHIRFANKLLMALKTWEEDPHAASAKRLAREQDLRTLYERLRRFFEKAAL